ncbi:MAG TPA: CPCC family cysteine-rich protein [Abditibacteriaceae bacterium]|jgi:hypothetical protein
MNPDPSSEEIERRKRWFEWYMNRLENHSVVESAKEGVRYHCPCCGYKTLSERGSYSICKVCFWEDDGQDDQDADVVRGGPNGALSLTQARINFREFGACEKRFIKNVRKPLTEEM